MKLHELFENRLASVTLNLPRLEDLDDLIDPKTGEYYTGVVNVTGDVDLSNRRSYHKKLKKFPVKFGKIGGYFNFDKNLLSSLEGVPQEINDDFSAFGNRIPSLEGIHKLIKKVNGAFYMDNNPIKSGGIGLILIEGLNKIQADQPAFEIIEQYLGQGKKGLLLCQDELIEAGLEAFAKL